MREEAFLFWAITLCLCLIFMFAFLTSCSIPEPCSFFSRGSLFQRIHSVIEEREAGGRFAAMVWDRGYLLAHEGADCHYVSLRGGITQELSARDGGRPGNLYGIHTWRSRCQVEAPLVGFLR
jgi:hypothetical protein